MSTCKKAWPALKGDRRAITMIEYAIAGALIAAVLVLAFPPVTAAVTAKFTTMADDLTNG